jgi:hypothetical protein
VRRRRVARPNGLATDVVVGAAILTIGVPVLFTALFVASGYWDKLLGKSA